jgi:DNA-nicking Smr family endonuclease
MSDEQNPFDKLKGQDFPDADAPDKSDDESLFGEAMQGVFEVSDPRGRKQKKKKPKKPPLEHNPFAGLKSADLKLKDGSKGPPPESSASPSGKKKKKKAVLDDCPCPQAPFLPKRKAAGPAGDPAGDHDTELPDDEASAFFSAMQGVERMGDDVGRAMHPGAQAKSDGLPPKMEKALQASEDEDVVSELRDLVDGRIEFTFEYTDEYMEGRAKDVKPAHLERLRRGEFAMEGHIDLHGCTVGEAETAVLDFLKEHYLHGSRCVLLIPGRGKNSPEGRGVLRREMQGLLTRDPLKRVVAAFATALPKHGGAGALYVLLRKYKKTGAKVQWDRMLGGEE